MFGQASNEHCQLHASKGGHVAKKLDLIGCEIWYVFIIGHLNNI